MKHFGRFVLLALLAFVMAACGEKKDSVERNLEAQKAIQEGMKKEKQMVEGMQKGMESLEKKMEEPKAEPKK
jgi:hypothetical protein